MPTVKCRFGPLPRELVEHAFDHRRRELLRREPVATADDARRDGVRRLVGVHGLVQRGPHVEVERLTDRTRLLRAVQHGDRPARRRQRPQERLGREGPVQPHRDQAHRLAALDHRVDRLGRGAGGRAHHHDHAVGVERAAVLDQRVLPAGALRQLVEHLLHDARDGQVERVRRLAGLEEHVGVLGRAPHHRPVRRHAPEPEVEQVRIADQGAEVVVVQQLDLGDLVAGAEAVEEVQERDPRPQRRRVGHEREVLGLLHRRRAQHRPPRRTGMHHVGVVTEDGQGVRGDRPGRHVDDGRGELTGDLEHVRHHRAGGPATP